MISALITIAVYILVMAILYALFEYLAVYMPIPEPPQRIVRLTLVVLFTLIVVLLLLSLVGVADIPLPRVH